MNDSHGLTKKSAFYGMIISNVAIIFFGPFARSTTRLLGTRVTLILSVILCGLINNALFYPTKYLVYGAFLLNGVGWAVFRVAALAYMTKNSTSASLSRNNLVHWIMWTVGLILGNAVVMLLNIHITEIGADKRYVIAIAMTALSLCAIPGYFFTRQIPEDYDAQIAAMVNENGQEEAHGAGTNIYGAITPITAFGDQEERGVLGIVADMYSVTCRNDTVLLLAPMFAAGVYASAYLPIIPTAVGAISKPWIVSAFGILVGLGQLTGAFITGSVVAKISMKKIAVVTSALSVLTFSLMALVVEMGFSKRWVQWWNFSEGLVLLLAFFIGACDMSNNVCLSVAIGRLFRENADAAFSLFVTVMSFSMISWYVLYTFTCTMLYVILILYSVVSVAAAFSFSSLTFE